MKTLIHRFVIALASACLLAPMEARSAQTLDLVPKPVSVERIDGAYFLSAGTSIRFSPGCQEEAMNLSQRLKSLIGLDLPVGQAAAGKPAVPAILLRLEPDSTLGTEGYRLAIHKDGILITAPETAGLFYGGITLAQLAYPPVPSGSGVSIPCVEITDYPRFAWRGIMLDCSRHFMPKEFIERLLDLMAMQKMNRFHWHLVDSEGWRLEIKKYPKLTQVSQNFPQSYPGENSDNPGGPRYRYGLFHGGGFYTQYDVREIVAYGAARHITIMPEIEFPGHSMAALTAYPEFSTTGRSPSVTSNISPDIFNVDDKSLQFLRDVLTEVMDIFPGQYIHFGGDEAPKKEWKESPFIQQKIKELGLKDENALQSWMFEQMANFVGSKGRRAVGWQEITKGGIPPNAIVMPWIGMKPGIDAANNGNDIIIAKQIPNYFTSDETQSPLEPFHRFWGVTLAAIYNQTFQYPEIRPENSKHVLGAQAELWTERLLKPADVEYASFPRSTALAEALWTPLGEKDFADFSQRLDAMVKRWQRYSPPVNYHYLTPPPFEHWTPETISSNHGLMEIAIPADDRKALSSGSCGLIFQYTKGSEGLSIHKVELVADGSVIATDAHEGFTGNQTRQNIYHLCPPAGANIPNSAKITLRVTADTKGVNSYGDITLLDGNLLAKFPVESKP